MTLVETIRNFLTSSALTLTIDLFFTLVFIGIIVLVLVGVGAMILLGL